MFTPEQLQIIHNAAKSVKNQGELAVLRKVIEYNKEKSSHWPYAGTIPETQMKVLEYCAEECKRQHSKEMSVYWMVNAWDFARGFQTEDWINEGEERPKIDLGFISHLGALVEPNKNVFREQYSFRRIPIGVGDGMGGWIEKSPWERVPFLLESLLESYYDGTLWDDLLVSQGVRTHSLSKSAEDQFYFEYENIHPFVDGNGRTGKILYNYLKGTLLNPVMPPNFWGSSNP